MERLAYDRFRCMGVNCPVKNQCLRHKGREDVRPNTPYFDASADAIILNSSDCQWFIELETQG